MSETSGASLKKVLRGGAPLFIIQRGSQHQGRLNEVFDELQTKHGKKLGLGLSLKMSKHNSKQMADLFSANEDIPVRIADPELYRHPDTGWEGIERAKERKTPHPWSFYSTLHTKPNRLWTREVIHSQFDAGATVALSATGWVDSAKAVSSLASAMALVAESREIAGERPMFVNLTMDFRWLIDRELRGILLEEIVESKERNWYLRFWWPLITFRYGQLLDEDVLRGYRVLARTAALEGKNLYLPNTGLTGWLMTGHGAAGFSTGTSWPDQAFARERVMGGRPGQKPPPRTPRIFDRAILHTIDHGVYERLQGLDGHTEYRTRFSDELDDGHSHEVAGLHYLASVGNLQAKLADRNPQIEVEKAVRRSTRWLRGLSPIDRPTGGNNPGHLPVWMDLLS